MQPRMIRTEVKLSIGSGTGLTDVERLSVLGRCGRIHAVKLRLEDSDPATAATLYIADDALTNLSNLDELDVFYESESIPLTASSTAVSYQDALPVPSPYAVDNIGDVRIVANIDSGAGASELLVVVYAEVWD